MCHACPFRGTRRGAMSRFVALSAFAPLLAATIASAQSIRFVRAGAPAGGDGQTWASAFTGLHLALDAAALDPSITQVWIAQGTYTPNRGAGNRADTFQLVGGVSVYGGFAGSETLLEQRDIIAHPTILSGDFNGNDG